MIGLIQFEKRLGIRGIVMAEGFNVLEIHEQMREVCLTSEDDYMNLRSP